MANDVAQNPYVIDTSATVVAAGQSVLINAIKVVSVTTSGQTVLIADANDNQFYEFTASVANGSSPLEDLCRLPINKRQLNGLKVTIPAGGAKVYIYC
jgi:hypothetical protein